MISTLKRVKEVIKDLTTLSILTGIFFIVKLLSFKS